jgi:nucleoside-diphosphate-sugar epimerase
MMRALVFGGSGQIGRAVAQRLAQQGWQVSATLRAGRDLPKTLVELGVHRLDAAPRAALIRGGWDVVIDPFAFTADDAKQLIAQREDFGTLCVISTASVYADAMGRGFETDHDLGFPEYPAEIAEDQPRVPPGEGYSAGKVAMEDTLLAADLPLILLRPAAIHGAGSRHPREWTVVKRLLDGRTTMPMKQNGQSVFHTTSTAGMASLILHLLKTSQTGTFNIADPVAMTTAALAQTIAGFIGKPLTILDATDAPDPVGHTPWSVPRPVRLSLAAALATGWSGPPAYADCLPTYLEYLLAHQGDWQAAFPGFAAYGHDPFDYAAEDAAFPPAR